MILYNKVVNRLFTKQSGHFCIDPQVISNNIIGDSITHLA